MKENEILNFDLVYDEYGNYYEVTRIDSVMGELKSITILNALYKIANNRLFDSEDLQNDYARKHISSFLVDTLNSRIKHHKREIKSIREIVESGVEVTVADYLK